MRAAKLSLLLVGLVACGSEGAPSTALLVGEWRWLETSGGFTGETRTNPDHRWRLRFQAGGTVREDYAGRPPATGRYDVEAGRGTAQGRDVLTLHLGGSDLVMIDDQPFEVTLRADTLVLGSIVSDGFMYRFARVGP